MEKKVLVVLGTRPEVIKLAPVIKLLRESDLHCDVLWTKQHEELAKQMLDYFEIEPDYVLNMMKGGELTDRLAWFSTNISDEMVEIEPDCIVVQGDTSTALAGTIAGFYKDVPVVHVEAGLRTHERNPWPEEMHRRAIAAMATWHCTTTRAAKVTLLAERGAEPDCIRHTGNTVVPALLHALHKTDRAQMRQWAEKVLGIPTGAPIIFVTGHRRENVHNLTNICHAMQDVLVAKLDAHIVWPVHPNPHVSAPIFAMLADTERTHLTAPLGYEECLWLMQKAAITVTDSGGIQEEAAVLGVPVLITRECTERPEVIDAGAGKLVSTDRATLFKAIVEATAPDQQRPMGYNPYCAPPGGPAENVVSVIKEAVACD